MSLVFKRVKEESDRLESLLERALRYVTKDFSSPYYTLKNKVGIHLRVDVSRICLLLFSRPTISNVQLTHHITFVFVLFSVKLGVYTRGLISLMYNRGEIKTLYLSIFDDQKQRLCFQEVLMKQPACTLEST